MRLGYELVRTQIFFRRELIERVQWFIRLRWAAVGMAALAGVGVRFFLEPTFPPASRRFGPLFRPPLQSFLLFRMAGAQKASRTGLSALFRFRLHSGLFGPSGPFRVDRSHRRNLQPSSDFRHFSRHINRDSLFRWKLFHLFGRDFGPHKRAYPGAGDCAPALSGPLLPRRPVISPGQRIIQPDCPGLQLCRIHPGFGLSRHFHQTQPEIQEQRTSQGLKRSGRGKHQVDGPL